MEFWQAVREQAFMQNALAAGLLAAVACGVIGSYVVVRRIVFISGGISHTILGGMGVAYFLGKSPLLGAVVAALAAALIIGVISMHTRQHEDTIIGALWAVGMAVGVLFISRTPGYNVDLMSYLFGDILLVPRSDLWLIGLLDAVIVGAVGLFYRQLLAASFDDEYAQLQGVRTGAMYLLLLCLTALTVVTLIRVVGLILVIALLTLPAAIAQQAMRSLGKMMLLATVLGFVFTMGGLAVSYTPDLPTGPTIIIIAGVCYLLAVAIRAGLAWSHRRAAGANPESGKA